METRLKVSCHGVQVESSEPFLCEVFGGPCWGVGLGLLPRNVLRDADACLVKRSRGRLNAEAWLTAWPRRLSSGLFPHPPPPRPPRLSGFLLQGGHRGPPDPRQQLQGLLNVDAVPRAPELLQGDPELPQLGRLGLHRGFP